MESRRAVRLIVGDVGLLPGSPFPFSPTHPVMGQSALRAKHMKSHLKFISGEIDAQAPFKEPSAETTA